MRRKQTWDLLRTHRHIAMIAMVLGSSTMVASCQSYLARETKPRQVQAMVTKSLEAQSFVPIKREMMPEDLEGALKATPGLEDTNGVITLGPVDLDRPGMQERTFLTAERFKNPDPVTRTVNLEEGPIELEVMPQNLEVAVKATPGLEETNAVITLGPNGQERTFLTSDRFDGSGNLRIQPFPTHAEQINGLIRTYSGVVYLSWEGSPDKQCQSVPGGPCLPVSHTH
jgi:hypothetical protein